MCTTHSSIYSTKKKEKIIVLDEMLHKICWRSKEYSNDICMLDTTVQYIVDPIAKKYCIHFNQATKWERNREREKVFVSTTNHYHQNKVNFPKYEWWKHPSSHTYEIRLDANECNVQFNYLVGGRANKNTIHRAPFECE